MNEDDFSLLLHPLTTPTISIPEEVVDIIEGDGGDQNIQNMLSSIVYSLGLDEGETLVAISNWHKRNILPTIDSATIRYTRTCIYLFIYLLFICLFIYLFICLFIYLFIYLVQSRLDCMS